MLATAGSLLAVTAILFAAGAVLTSVWAFADLLVRPSIACRVAHVSKNKWLVALGLAPVFTVITSVAFAFHLVHGLGFALLFLGLGAAALFVGLVGGIWYLVAVRPWIAAQINFARPSSEAG